MAEFCFVLIEGIFAVVLFLVAAAAIQITVLQLSEWAIKSITGISIFQVLQDLCRETGDVIVRGLRYVLDVKP